MVGATAKPAAGSTGPDDVLACESEAYQRQTVKIALERELVVRFRHEAARRDVPVTRLIHELLDVIAADELVGAVLDDGP